MDHLHLADAPTPTTDIDEASIRAFVERRGADRTAQTRQRYGEVVDDLFAFLDTVDVRPWLGPQIAEHLEAARRNRGSGAFLPTLGAASMLRVLPAFLDDPWLPPSGVRRRSHRVVAEHVLTLLRRWALTDSGLMRHDLRRARRSIGTARARDYDWRPYDEPDDDARVSVTVTLDLRSGTVDSLLDGVERGRHTSMDAAIAAIVDPDPHDSWGGGW
jgi:hypothetical protein